MDAEEAALSLVGTTVADKYRLLSLLGAGGMGAVYEAEHVFTKRRVALKRMHQGIARSKIAAERFVRESQAPSSIGHPGIVQVLDGGFETDGSLYLVLELLDGVSMGDALDEETLEPAAVTQIGIELLEALAAAHDKGFIHRDIKPDNVFLAHDGRGGVTVKLLDFGIASMRDTEGDVKLTKTGAILGTPLYMSPEQAKGQRIDPRSDLWSVGAMLYRALSGISPYTGDTYNALIVSIVTQQHVDLGELCPELPASLLDVVSRALQKSPDDRFDSAAQMASALREVRFDDTNTGEREKTPSLPPYSSLKPPAPQVAATVAGGRRPKRPAAEADPAFARTEHSTSLGFINSTAASPAPSARAVFVAQDIEPARPLGVIWLVATLVLLLGLGYFALRPKGAQVPPPSAAGEIAAPGGVDPSAEATEPAAAEPEAKTEKAEPSAEQAAAQDEPEPPSAAAAEPEATPEAKQAEPQAEPAADTLSADAVTAVLAERQADMQQCLEEAVVAQMLAGGAVPGALRLDVELKIAASGHLDDVTVTGQAPGELAKCVRARLLTAEFPRAARPTTFRYPLVLAPKIVGR